jgi:hypothetical protein
MQRYLHGSCMYCYLQAELCRPADRAALLGLWACHLGGATICFPRVELYSAVEAGCR